MKEKEDEEMREREEQCECTYGQLQKQTMQNNVKMTELEVRTCNRIRDA